MFSFTRRLPAAPRPHPAGHARTAPPEPSIPACGWFDSSHELRAGLRVEEELPPEAVARLVPPSWWLAWELDAALPSVRAGRT